MKMMIEVDIPHGRSVAEAEMAVKMAFSPEWMAQWWHISDIYSCASGFEEEDAGDISNEEAQEVLRLMEKYHDCEVGINWDVINNWIDHIKSQRREIKNA
jgi:hypothetical protein